MTRQKYAHATLDAAKIDSIFTAVDRCDRPGAAVGIALDGIPVYRKGFGLASMELPILLSPAIRMRIGSITKHFAALCYLLLCEDGRAGIDDLCGRYLPELHPVTHTVSMRQLMGNASGLRDAHDIRWQFSGMDHDISSRDLLSLYQRIDDVNFQPGSAWCYNNGGFLIVTAVIERITGQPLEEVMRELIFAPIGMNDTMLRRFDSDFVTNSATMHMSNSVAGYDKSYLAGALDGSGGMVSSVDDMLRWLAHMEAPWVGIPETWKVMKTPQILANGTSTGYGFGLITGDYRGIETLFHTGGVLGSNAQMLKVPAARLDIVVMVNRHDISSMSLVNDIIDSCLPNLDPIEEKPRIPPATGVFCSPTTGRVVQLATLEGEQIALIDGYQQPVIPGADGTLKPPKIWGFVKLAIQLQGDPQRPDGIHLDYFGNPDQLLAIRSDGTDDRSTILGSYRSKNTDTEATISEADGEMRLRTIGRFGSAMHPLVCLAKGIWRSTSGASWGGGGILLFDENRTTFTFTSVRNRALSFRRLTDSPLPA